MTALSAADIEVAIKSAADAARSLWFRRGGNYHEADDVGQEASIAVVIRLKRFDSSRGSVKLFGGVVGRSVAMDFAKNRRRQRENANLYAEVDLSSEHDFHDQPCQQQRPSPEDELIQKETAARFLSSFVDEKRAAAAAAVLEGETPSAAATANGLHKMTFIRAARAAATETLCLESSRNTTSPPVSAGTARRRSATAPTPTKALAPSETPTAAPSRPAERLPALTPPLSSALKDESHCSDGSKVESAGGRRSPSTKKSPLPWPPCLSSFVRLGEGAPQTTTSSPCPAISTIDTARATPRSASTAGVTATVSTIGSSSEPCGLATSPRKQRRCGSPRRCWSLALLPSLDPRQPSLACIGSRKRRQKSRAAAKRKASSSSLWRSTALSSKSSCGPPPPVTSSCTTTE